MENLKQPGDGGGSLLAEDRINPKFADACPLHRFRGALFPTTIVGSSSRGMRTHVETNSNFLCL